MFLDSATINMNSQESSQHPATFEDRIRIPRGEVCQIGDTGSPSIRRDLGGMR